MATYRAQVVIPYFTNFPTDVITNTLHFTELTPVGLAAASATLTPLIRAFYDAIYTGTRFAGSYINGPLASVRWYDLSTPPPRVPIILPLGSTFNVAAVGIPTEVAAVVSFQGLPVAGVPQARRRGRIYLGALSSGFILNNTATTFPVLLPAAITAINLAAKALRDQVALTQLRWAVWSSVDQVATQVNNGWCDNTPDTQRRRGVDATARTLWS